MQLGVLQLDLSIPGAMSLKDKRRAIKSVKDRIAHRWNVSVAETDAQDTWRRAVFGVAMIGSDHSYVAGALAKVVDFVRTVPQVDLDDYRIDFV
ncbi:MAG: DUF503 domain-containing protein [Planctomycetota bacterium]